MYIYIIIYILCCSLEKRACVVSMCAHGACIHISYCVCMFVCVHAYECMRVCVSVRACMRECVHACVCVHVCVCVYMYVRLTCFDRLLGLGNLHVHM